MNNLRISSTPALIGIQTNPGRLEIQQPKADMELNIQHPRVEIHSEQVKVQIDQYQCFAEAGLKNFLDLTRENAAFARQQLAQAVDRIVRQGDEMVASLHKGVDMIPIHAEENAFERNRVDYNIETIPKSRPRIDYTGGTVDINVIEGSVDAQVRMNKPIIDFKIGSVDIYLRQKNSINIEYVGNQLDVTG